jgi:hypothetical protein
VVGVEIAPRKPPVASRTFTLLGTVPQDPPLLLAEEPVCVFLLKDGFE